MILDGNRRIGSAAFIALIEDAIERDDHALLERALVALPREAGSKVASVLFKRAYEMPPERFHMRLLLHDMSMSANKAPLGAFNNALHFLGTHAGKPEFDPELARRWLARAVPHAPANPYIFHNAAYLYITLGEREAALRMIAGAVLYTYEHLSKLLAAAEYASLHDDPRYAAIVAPTTPREVVRDVFQGIDRRARAPLLRNAAFEAAIAADPTAVDPYLVYGDWLQERGDPRGALIAIQHALQAAPDDPELRRAEAEHLARHAPALLGGLAANTLDHDGVRDAKALTWHLGFVRRAFFRYVAYQMHDRHVPSVEELVRDFFACESSRFVTELSIGVEEPGDSHDQVVAAIALAPRPTIRALHLAEFEYPDDSELSWVELGDLSALWPALPALRTLTLQAGSFELGAPDVFGLPELRELVVHTSGLTRANLDAIVSARLPALERLELWFGSTTYGCDITAEAVAPILDGAHPSLTHLALANAEFTDASCAMLATSRLLPRLHTLDLSRGTMTATGLAALVAAAPAFAHLDVLDLSQNHLVGELDPRVHALARRVVVDDQREPFDDGDRYVAVGE